MRQPNSQRYKVRPGDGSPRAASGVRKRVSHLGCVYGDRRGGGGCLRGGGGGCLRGGGGLCVGLGAFLGSGVRRGADVAGPDSGPVFGTVGFGCGFDVGRG